MSSYNVNIFASFDQKSLIDPQAQLMVGNNVSTYLNTVASNQTASIYSHVWNEITGLSITSNGITDGNFNIFPVKYAGTKINFVVQLIDNQGYSVKDYYLLQPSNCNFVLSGLNGQIFTSVQFYSNFGTLSSLTQGGFYKGYLISPITATNVSIYGGYTDSNVSVSGWSSVFNIYDSNGPYDIRKINEDFDQTAAYKSIATQPVLYDKTQLMTNYLGQIVGNANSDPNTLGIETYEKISNYVSNINDPDYCNIDSLKSLLDMVNSSYQNFNTFTRHH